MINKEPEPSAIADFFAFRAFCFRPLAIVIQWLVILWAVLFVVMNILGVSVAGMSNLSTVERILIAIPVVVATRLWLERSIILFEIHRALRDGPVRR